MDRNQLLRLVVLVVLSAGMLVAQVTTGTISGTVKDSTGAVLPGAKVTILNEDTGISRTVEADASGRYSAPGLGLGNYRVTSTQEGFQTEVRSGIVLTVGREAIVDLSLTVGAVTQTVEVTGEAPMVESTTAALGSLVDDHTIRALPLNGRSYDQLAELQPGVILTSPGATAGVPFNFGTGKKFSVGGQREISNSFLLDGTNINDHANGTPGGASGTNLGVDTIREFKIFTNSFKAEYGHSAGSVVSAVTRSGTNSLHGTAFEYIRNSALDARNFFDIGSSPPPFKRNQFGGVLGGPIKKDKTFFFGGYEGLRQALGTTLIATVPTTLARQGILPTGAVSVNPAILPFLNQYPLPNGRDFGNGTAQFLSAPSVVTREDNSMVRVDHQLNDKTGIFGRYTFDQDSLNAPLALPDQMQNPTSRRQYTTLQANSILGPKALNNFRVAFNRSNSRFNSIITPDPGVTLVPNQPEGPVSIGGINGAGSRPLTPLGTGNIATGIWVFNTLEWSDDLSYVTGKHSFKTGVDIQRIRDNTASTTAVSGNLAFATFNTFLQGIPATIQASSPVGVLPYFGLRQSLFALYAQDDYTVNSRLTLNLGLRWEAATDPNDVKGQMSRLPSISATSMVVSNSFFSIGKKNFEPRVGLAWRLNESGKTVLRAGGGIYHNQLLPWLYAFNISSPPFFGTLNANNPPFPNPAQALVPGTALVALKTMDTFEKTPAVDQYTLSIQQQMSKNTVIEIAYAGNKGNHLPLQEDPDLVIPTVLANGQLFFPAGVPIRNPAWSSIRLIKDEGNSVYNSLTIKLRTQNYSGFQGQIFYTFSRATDAGSNQNSAESTRSAPAVMYPYNLHLDWGLSEFDSRHAVVFNGSYALPFRTGSKALGAVVNGWTIDGIGTFTAGQPFSARLTANVSRTADANVVDRPNLNPGASNNPNHGTSSGCAGFPAGTELGGAGNFYDPCSFSLQPAGTLGNVGRNTIIGPGIMDVDLALEKAFKLREAANVTFRAEMFNVMNHTNFGLPNTTALASNGTANPSAGVITFTTTSARQIQFALRINF